MLLQGCAGEKGGGGGYFRNVCVLEVFQGLHISWLCFKGVFHGCALKVCFMAVL